MADLASPWREHPDEIETLNAEGRDCMHGHIGLEFVERGPNWLKARMPVDHRTKQPHGLLHGGASVVLSEAVASVAGSQTVDPRVGRVVGLEINANHIRPATRGFVHGVATPEALGRRNQVWTVRITDDADRLVCLSRVTLAVIPPA